MLNATERKALTLSAFAASCLTFAPGEIVSGVVLLAVSGALWRWDERLTRREAEAARAAAAAGAAGDSEAEARAPAASSEGA